MAHPGFVIIGAGLAGAKAAEALRNEGFDREITLIGNESERPYERPPLSKEYLQGKADRETIFVHRPEWYSEHGVDLRLNLAATGIDRERHEVVVEGGERVGYDKLLLATGSAPRRLPVPGADADNVLHLRRVQDSDRIRDALRSAEQVVIIGAGWIGLEVAAAARAADTAVTVVETAELPLLRVLGTRIAPVFAELHREHEVDLRLGTGVETIVQRDGRATEVLLTDGGRIGCDAVIVGVGATPHTELATAAGIEVSDGVVVDSALRSSDPDVHAAGDVARAFHPLLGTHIRVEHWANALDQPATAARGMLGDPLAAYDRVPYFFTDQYDLGMEYAGHVEPDGYDDVVVRGDLAARDFVAFWLSQGRVLAGMNVNVWDVNDAVQRLVRSGDQVDPAALADPAVPLTGLVGTS
ncbi:FAD-dependent oxidoreductase [Saccharopolyspora sp. NFXS83]|uniref:NAD(P)/FAD-dependent oxidoreductase n=1 Tax=Saccharopolyspora sp. NFXS83 TaxID=2993560 RepID=UPI00224B16A8|nr:FAD-dependent oxidoreductase [Saccharopolyspora sp. NFXS83]MCX2729510.1 FAD-dependent oxidoreductase [Saccharopolyspora sp. NFXS83]